MSSSRFPYVAQFGSPALIDQFLAGTRELRADPAWQLTGAPDVASYEQWARVWCGMACLKSVLAYVGSPHASKSLYELAQLSVSYGGYVPQADGRMGGLFYRQFVDMLIAEFNLGARVAAPIDLAEVCSEVQSGAAVICSVHNSIRDMTVPPSRGGHLVLVTDAESVDGTTQLTFHNPSGSPRGGQSDVVLDVASFEPYFAMRGVVIQTEGNTP